MYKGAWRILRLFQGMDETKALKVEEQICQGIGFRSRGPHLKLRPETGFVKCLQKNWDIAFRGKGNAASSWK